MTAMSLAGILLPRLEPGVSRHIVEEIEEAARAGLVEH